jgi:hypothetical protein
MDSDQPIHTTKVDGECRSLAWRPNGKQTDDAGEDAARKSTDNFILATRWVDQRTGFVKNGLELIKGLHSHKQIQMFLFFT